MLATKPLSFSATRAVAAATVGVRRVVVTGMGCVTPLGADVATTWTSLTSNNETLGGITSLHEALLQQNLPAEQFEKEWRIAQTLPCQVAAPVRQKWIHESYVDTRTARFVQLALQAAEEACRQSHLPEHLGLKRRDKGETENTSLENNDSDDELFRRRRSRVGVSIGSGMSGSREFSRASDLLYNDPKGLRRLSPHFIPKVLPNSCSGRVGIHFNLGGPSFTASSACAAGAHAIGDAVRAIQHSQADVMVCGGAEATIDPLSLAGFCRLRALSTQYNNTPSLASRPFDVDRDGFVMGEGAAILVLEEREHALEREVPILCEVTGYGLSSDGYHITSPDPKGAGAERAMEQALAQHQNHQHQYKVHNNSCGGTTYINAHATSTPMGDDVELQAIRRLLMSKGTESNGGIHNTTHTHTTFVSSTKGATGHLLGAAGALEALFTCLALKDQTIPPTRNLEHALVEDCDNSRDTDKHRSPIILVQTPSSSTQTDNDTPSSSITCASKVHLVSGTSALKILPDSPIQTAMSNSFGFGGTNVSLTFGRYEK
jgi:3-oxoacyl-[acyl-carrier-protein] synthase II